MLSESWSAETTGWSTLPTSAPSSSSRPAPGQSGPKETCRRQAGRHAQRTSMPRARTSVGGLVRKERHDQRRVVELQELQPVERGGDDRVLAQAQLARLRGRGQDQVAERRTGRSRFGWRMPARLATYLVRRRCKGRVHRGLQRLGRQRLGAGCEACAATCAGAARVNERAGADRPPDKTTTDL